VGTLHLDDGNARVFVSPSDIQLVLSPEHISVASDFNFESVVKAFLADGVALVFEGDSLSRLVFFQEGHVVDSFI